MNERIDLTVYEMTLLGPLRRDRDKYSETAGSALAAEYGGNHNPPRTPEDDAKWQRFDAPILKPKYCTRVDAC